MQGATTCTACAAGKFGLPGAATGLAGGAMGELDSILVALGVDLIVALVCYTFYVAFIRLPPAAGPADATPLSDGLDHDVFRSPYRYHWLLENLRRWFSLDDKAIDRTNLHFGGQLYLRFHQLVIVLLIVCSAWGGFVLIPIYATDNNRAVLVSALQNLSIANLVQGSPKYCTRGW